MTRIKTLLNRKKDVVKCIEIYLLQKPLFEAIILTYLLNAKK
jgi:hypothetical protein